MRATSGQGVNLSVDPGKYEIDPQRINRDNSPFGEPSIICNINPVIIHCYCSHSIKYTTNKARFQTSSRKNELS